MKDGERRAKRENTYNAMESEKDSKAERQFCRQAKAYAKYQTVMELHRLMQISDLLDDEDRREIHRISVKHPGSRT